MLQAPEALAWLKRACDKASEPLSDDDDNEAEVGGIGMNGISHTPMQMCKLRQLLFPPGPNAYSRLSIHDFSDSINALPAEELRQVLLPSCAVQRSLLWIDGRISHKRFCDVNL